MRVRRPPGSAVAPRDSPLLRSVRSGTKLCRRPASATVPSRWSPSATLTAAELLAISCCVSGILLS